MNRVKPKECIEWECIWSSCHQLCIRFPCRFQRYRSSPRI